jgi:uncharacterized protein (DUF427 family)
MASGLVLSPGPDHPITIERNPNRVQVRAGDRLIADTSAALTLREANYPPVHYIPRRDVDMAQLSRSEHASYCPYKGDAAYFDIVALGDSRARTSPGCPARGNGENAVWTYETPPAAVGEIAEYLAFYPDRVEISEEAEAV